MSDKTDLRLIMAMFEHQATHDALTDLPNRAFLLEQIQRAIDTAKINHSYFGIILLNIDRFKLINDSLSYAMGDELLKSLAKRLKLAIRLNDTVATLGGDEFVVLASNLMQPDNIRIVVQKLLDVLAQPFKIGEREIVLHACIGISLYPRDGETADALLSNADSAMCFAKANGGNQFQFYTKDMDDQGLLRLDQEAEMRRGIANQEFFLCYQPQIDVASQKLIAVEALVRWQHPEKGIISPWDFIPLAEETGLIVPLGEWIMRTACAQNKAWQEAGFMPFRMAVNVATQQFRQKNFLEMVSEILMESGLSPRYLEIEVTENVIVNTPEILATLAALKKIGLDISLDDFGSGYSSLSYLKRIALDRLKIDREFIQNIDISHDDEVIIRAILAMANSLGLEVIAEGVETKEQLVFLNAEKCTLAQGYYFSKPLVASELEAFIKQQLTFKTNS